MGLSPMPSGALGKPSGASVTKPLIVTISHTLGKVEATRRLRTGLAEVKNALAANKVVLVDYSWADNRAQFSVRALGQTVSGTIEAEDEIVRLEAQLPWLLSVFAERVKNYVARRATLLLEKK